MKTTTFRYSIGNATFAVTLLWALVALSAPHLMEFINLREWANVALISAGDLLLITMAIQFFIKYFIPALQNKIALEINPDALVSYIKDVAIEWKDVKDISIVSGRYSSSLYIKFKYETNHGDSIKIGLRYVKGDDDKIYTKAKYYFDNYN
jgi:hypothetical protein